jgi:hypothetical protein
MNYRHFYSQKCSVFYYLNDSPIIYKKLVQSKVRFLKRIHMVRCINYVITCNNLLHV